MRTLKALALAICIVTLVWSTGTKYLPAQDMSVLDVRAMGAKGDGVADDRIPIQKAIDLAESSGKAVYFPPGKYYLRPYTNVKDAFLQNRPAYRCLKIDSDGVELRFEKNAVLLVDADDDTHGRRGVVVLYLDGVSGIRLGGINIANTGNKKPSDEYYSGVEVGSDSAPCSRVVVENAEIKHLGSGVRFWAARNCHVYNSYLHHCCDTAFNGHGRSQDCTIERSTITHSGDGNCTFYGGNMRCGIRGCYLTGSNQVGVIESSHYSFIEDCYFDGTDGSVNNGPIVNRSRHATVRGNKIVGVHKGIVLRETDISDAGGVPVWGALVEGNQIIDTQERIKDDVPCGILIEHTAGALISNNIFMRTRKTGSKIPCEILIVDRGKPSPKGFRNEGLRIIGNQFILKHNEVGFGYYSDTHYVLKNNLKYVLDGLSFSNNTIIAQQKHGWDHYLVDVGCVNKFQFIGNTSMMANDPALGPEHLLSGSRIGQAVISNNTCSFEGGDLFFLPHCSKVVISDNVITGAGHDPGDWLRLGTQVRDVTVTDNVIRSSRFISADASPRNCIIKNNIVEYGSREPFLNINKDQNIVADNLLKHF